MTINMFFKMLSKRPLTIFIATHNTCAPVSSQCIYLSLSGLCMSRQPPLDFLLFTQITEPSSASSVLPSAKAAGGCLT